MANLKAAVFFVYHDESEVVESEGLRLRRCRLTINADMPGRLEGLRVCGFDESTAVYRLLVNGRRVWPGSESLDESGDLAAPKGEQWRVGCGSVLEVLMRGHFERVGLIVERDPAPPAAACELCKDLTLVDVPRAAMDPKNPHHPSCRRYVAPGGAR
jgi:hypothetical protein